MAETKGLSLEQTDVLYREFQYVFFFLLNVAISPFTSRFLRFLSCKGHFLGIFAWLKQKDYHWIKPMFSTVNSSMSFFFFSISLSLRSLLAFYVFFLAKDIFLGIFAWLKQKDYHWIKPIFSTVNSSMSSLFSFESRYLSVHF
jgi:hypothetical protein